MDRDYLVEEGRPRHGPESLGEMPDLEHELPPQLLPGLQNSPHDLQVGLASDPGRIRDHNEDSSLALQFMLAQQGLPPLPMGLFAIADGMGGHAQGEQASALAVRLAARYIHDDPGPCAWGWCLHRPCRR
jgi:hypothetical protein